MMVEESDAATTANPLDAAGAADARPFGAGSAPIFAAAVDGIDIEAGLKDGTLSSDKAIVQLHRQMAQQKQQMAGMAERLGGGGGAPLAEALVRKVLGRHTEAPTNQHQV
jgi:hypothetical protein